MCIRDSGLSISLTPDASCLFPLCPELCALCLSLTAHAFFPVPCALCPMPIPHTSCLFPCALRPELCALCLSLTPNASHQKNAGGDFNNLSGITTQAFFI